MARGVKGTGPRSRQPRRKVAPARASPSQPRAPAKARTVDGTPHAVKVAKAGGLDPPLPKPLERSAGMLAPIGPHIAAPEMLDDTAAAEWRRIAELQGEFGRHRLSWISELDAAPLAAYCTAWSVWCQAVAAMNRKARRGLVQAGKEIPEVKLERDASRRLLAVARDLGLTSMVRARIQAGMAGPDAEPEDDLLA